MSETGTAVARPGRRRGAERERLLAAAACRFYADGVAATGIDTITAEAGVAKMSLYNNFSSKADLVMAYLDARHEEWLGLYRRRLEEARDGRGGVLAVFGAYADHAAFAYEHGFRGCGLLNAAAELPAGDEGRAVVRRHKEEVEDLLAGHLEELLPGRPRKRARWRSTCRSCWKARWHGPDWRVRVRVWSMPGRWRPTCWTGCDAVRRTRGRLGRRGGGVRADGVGAVGHHGHRRDVRPRGGAARARGRPPWAWADCSRPSSPPPASAGKDLDCVRTRGWCRSARSRSGPTPWRSTPPCTWPGSPPAPWCRSDRPRSPRP